VEGRCTPSSYGQPSPFVEESIPEMLAHQTHVMQVVVFNNGLIAKGHILR